MARILSELLVDDQVPRHGRRIVRAFTPRRSRFCSSSRNISSSADGCAEDLIVASLRDSRCGSGNARRAAPADRSRRAGWPARRAAAAFRSAGSPPSRFDSSAASAARPRAYSSRLRNRSISRELHLVIEQEAVFAPPGEQVQPEAHAPQECPAGDQNAELSLREEPVARPARRGASRRRCRRVSQRRSGCRASHRAALHVRLQVVRRVVEA